MAAPLPHVAPRDPGRAAGVILEPGLDAVASTGPGRVLVSSQGPVADALKITLGKRVTDNSRFMLLPINVIVFSKTGNLWWLLTQNSQAVLYQGP